MEYKYDKNTKYFDVNAGDINFKALKQNFAVFDRDSAGKKFPGLHEASAESHEASEKNFCIT